MTPEKLNYQLKSVSLAKKLQGNMGNLKPSKLLHATVRCILHTFNINTTWRVNILFHFFRKDIQQTAYMNNLEETSSSTLIVDVNKCYKVKAQRSRILEVLETCLYPIFTNVLKLSHNTYLRCDFSNVFDQINKAPQSSSSSMWFFTSTINFIVYTKVPFCKMKNSFITLIGSGSFSVGSWTDLTFYKTSWFIMVRKKQKKKRAASATCNIHRDH